MNRLGTAERTLHWVEHSDHIITEDFDKEEVFTKALEFVKARVPSTP